MNKIRESKLFSMVIFLFFLGACSYESESALCSVEFRASDKEPTEILQDFESAAKQFGYRYSGYTRKFPSGEVVTIGSAKQDKTAIGVVNLDMHGMYSIAFYEHKGESLAMLEKLAKLWSIDDEATKECKLQL